MPTAERATHHPPAAVLPRMVGAMWRQGTRSGWCPAEPRLEGRTALVTGGSRGIGLETSRGLAARGAEVVSASRGEAAGRAAARALAAEQGVPAHFVPLDLGDLESLPAALDALAALLAGRPLDVLIANAGLWPLRYATSAQGHEIAFATNVLGHFALLRGLRGRELLAPDARVVLVTGDIYVLARECTPDFSYRGAWGGQLAYCRSKLGDVWMARELARREPGLRVHAAHPGVIASELGVSSSGVFGALRRRIMLSPEAGAQTALFCATQPDLPTGSYYHNTLGRVELAPDDPGADDARAAALWETLERLAPSAA